MKPEIKSNEEVIMSWIHGNPCEGKNLKTDGSNLYSYGLKIGYTKGETGKKFVYGYKGRFSVSTTTTNHVRTALRLLGVEDGDAIIPPGGFGELAARGEIREKIRNRSRPDIYR